MKKLYNIYFGTIGKTLGLRYRYTKSFKSEEEALKYAKNEVKTLYFKNEGTHGLPSFEQIMKEHDITGIDVEDLYMEHIEDMCRVYVIPTELDTISQNKLKY
jgi:hypothetical protein